MSAHTPGPFPKLITGTYTTTDLFRAVKEHACVAFDNRSQGLVAVTGPADEESAQRYARLFAAAPELLEALTKLEARVTEHGYGWRELDEARAAIAKARGTP